MDSSGLSPFLQQLPYHLPILIVSLVGLSLSVIFWSRCPGPALLTLIATVLLLVTTVAVIGAQNYIISARLENGWTNQKFMEMSNMVSLIATVVRALSIGMLVIAVFMGRNRPSAGPANMPPHFYR
jgi:uncharacterized membrane protein